MRYLTQILTAASLALLFAACGEPLEAETVPEFEQVDASPTGQDVDADSNTDGSTDTAGEPAAPTQTVSCDKDGDGYCPTNAAGKVVDCNDSPLDANTDGIVDGAQFTPGLQDICDGKDNDCDGVTDEDAAKVQMYPDKDGDGYGKLGSTVVETCKTDGFAKTHLDCNDDDKSIHPGAKDLPGDGVDADCDDEYGDDQEVPDGPKSAELFVFMKATMPKLTLSYHVFNSWAKVGEDFEGKVQTTWDDHVVASIPEEKIDGTCGVRFSVEVEWEGGQKTWTCLGNGDSAHVNPEVFDATNLLAWDEEVLGSVKTWSDPSGQGCSLLMLWSDKPECQPAP